MKLRFICLLIPALALVGAVADPIAPATAPVAKTTGSIGFDYSTGDYGESSSTNMLSIPAVAQWDMNPWSLKVVVPYLHVSGPGNVVGGVGPVLNPSQAPNQTRSGLGDIVTSATYNAFTDPAAGLSVDLTGKIKFGTASRDRGLGTGKTDLSFQVDLYKSLGDLTPFASAGYRVLGSPPDITLDDVFFGSVGVDERVTKETNLGASFLLQQRISSTIDPARELTIYVSHRLDDGWRLQGYVVTGFTNASPKFELGGVVGYAF